jgi:AAA domain
MRARDIMVEISSAAPTLDARPLTAEELHTTLAPREYVVKPIIPLAAVTELSGAHGISKSTLALDVCLHVACGHEWAGLRTRAGRVVFISREDARNDILRRVQMWLAPIDAEARARCERALLDRLLLIGREQSKSLKLTAREYGTTYPCESAIAALAKHCTGAELVVLETASRLGGGDESNEDLAALAEALEQLAEQTAAGIIIVRHVSKEAARAKVSDSYAGRGGGALSDAARSVLVLVQLTDEQAGEHGIELGEVDRGALMLTHAKASYSECIAPLFFVRRRGPVVVPVRARSQADVEDEKLLTYMRSQNGEHPSLRQIARDCGLHGISSRRVGGVLERLRARGLVAAEKVKRRGGTCVLWMPVT